jgi:hypothetical protein
MAFGRRHVSNCSSAEREGYAEFNFSPSERWAAYDFTGYRTGQVDRAMARPPVVTPRRGGDVLFLDVAIPTATLPPLPWRYGLTAVLEEEGRQILLGSCPWRRTARFPRSRLLRGKPCGTGQGMTFATVRFGIDRLLADPQLRKPLIGKRVALVAHPASLTADLVHSLDALAALEEVNLTAAFGPQHGLKGDKQDNMVESADFIDPDHGIPVFSLYGEVRRPTAAMMDHADVFLFDLQDLGCRIYTFLTTLLYLLEAASGTGKAVWVLDRPNPAGRPVEERRLSPGMKASSGPGRSRCATA